MKIKKLFAVDDIQVVEKQGEGFSLPNEIQIHYNNGEKTLVFQYDFKLEHVEPQLYVYVLDKDKGLLLAFLPCENSLNAIVRLSSSDDYAPVIFQTPEGKHVISPQFDKIYAQKPISIDEIITIIKEFQQTKKELDDEGTERKRNKRTPH